MIAEFDRHGGGAVHGRELMLTPAGGRPTCRRAGPGGSYRIEEASYFKLVFAMQKRRYSFG